MNNLRVKNLKIAKKYSNALFETSCNAQIEDEVLSNLSLIVQTFQTNKELYDFMVSPIIKIEDKKDVLNKVFSVDINEKTLDFLYLLADNSRLDTICEIRDWYLQSYNEQRKIEMPIITSAVELEEEQKTRIVEKLTRKLNKTVTPIYKTNKEIIGGLVIEIGDKTIDCSLKSKFENMRKQLTKGNRYDSN